MSFQVWHKRACAGQHFARAMDLALLCQQQESRRCDRAQSSIGEGDRHGKSEPMRAHAEKGQTQHGRISDSAVA